MGKPLHDTLGGDCCCCIAEDRGCWCKSPKHPDDTRAEECLKCNEEAGREENFLLTVDFQSHVSSALNGSSVCTHFFTFTLMMTGAFS